MKSLSLASFSFYLSCLWLLFASSFCTLCLCNQNSNQVKCIATERSALNQFKNHLVDRTNRLSSWSGYDCCSWSGVVCDNSTHHVHELRLSGHCRRLSETYDEYEETRKQKLEGMISPSLIKLEQLRYLDLSCNNFEFTQIPAFISSLQNLRYLNISGSQFVGEIPHQLGNLSALLVLDVHDNYLQSENLKWIENMKQLQYLDMGGINLTGASDWVQVINTLPSLQELHFSSCGLTQFPIEPTRLNFTSLTVLDLSYNFFTSLLPEWIFSLHDLISLDLTLCSIGGLSPRNHGGFDSMPSLRTLHLSFNNFVNSPSILKGLPSLSNLRLLDVSNCNLSDPIFGNLQNLSQIAHLDLSSNQIVEEIPRFLSSLCNLTTLDLQSNRFSGDVSELLERLCECESPKLEVLFLRENLLVGRLPQKLGRLKNLTWIDITNNNLTGILPRSLGSLSLLKRLELSTNQLEGSIPDSIGDMSLLITLDLSTNQIEGSIPDSVGNLSSLEMLDLSYNKLNGSLPKSVGKLGKLIVLYLQHNSLTGSVTKNHFANLTALQNLWVGDNRLDFDLEKNWIPPFQLILLNLGSCNLGPLFPLWVQSQTILQVLGLENTNISGTIPDFWMNWESLAFLNLENNKLSGTIPLSLGNIPSLEVLRMHNNKLSGDLPISLFNSNILWIVDLAKNELTGRIPTSIGRNNTSLKVLSLRSNKLEGEIPNELCHLSSIQILDIADNSFSGYLPICFTNFSVISGKEKPTEIFRNEYIFLYEGPRDMSLVIKGHVSVYNTILPLVTAFDLSNNKFSGSIPKELVTLSGLRYLNISKNKLTGSIPNTFGEMRELESLDLSENNLNGSIPLSLAGLSALSWLNVSYNNLTGSIPTGRQFQTFNESSFIGNSLCGAPLLACLQNSGNTTRTNHDHDEADGTDWILLICMIMGLAVGFWITIGPLIVSKQWRDAYYRFLDEMRIKLANCILLVSIFGRRIIHRGRSMLGF